MSFSLLILGFGYFGTIAGTSIGLYLLDTINMFPKMSLKYHEYQSGV